MVNNKRFNTDNCMHEHNIMADIMLRYKIPYTMYIIYNHKSLLSGGAQQILFTLHS